MGVKIDERCTYSLSRDIVILLIHTIRVCPYLHCSGSVLLPVLRALRAAHDMGFMHRDVKASNILLGPQVGNWSSNIPIL